jgi:hypothetical protein
MLADNDGNVLDMSHTDFSYLKPHLLKLLCEQKDASVEIEELDRGRIFFTLQKLEDSWVLSQTRLDLYGTYGITTESVKLDDITTAIGQIKKMRGDEEEEEQDEEADEGEAGKREAIGTVDTAPASAESIGKCPDES